MRFYHNSQQEEYRRPFGAVKTGEEIRLVLSALEIPSTCHVLLRLWREKKGETYLPMAREEAGEGKVRFSCVLHAPEVPGLLWYSFQVLTENGCLYYGNNTQGLGGKGDLYPGLPPSFQITVYRSWNIPAWYGKAIVYQIFPDRFARGQDWLERTVASLRPPGWKGPGRILRLDWEDTPQYEKNEKGEVVSWDFFGGTLEGIREKLNWLESFGVGAIYLNPIFEAASNHRYDTANYRKVDPRLGDEASFVTLCREAREHGISIILDGVFNHTGSDSLYFDSFSNYGGGGAWKNPASPYAAWYRFTNEARTEYESWWGVKDLPGVEEANPSYQNYIFRDEDAVVRHWMRLGGKGWRLDVADELPDSFIQDLRQVVKGTEPEGVLLGEVWEDASHKVSYGQMRAYFSGKELDGVMNYPLRDLLLGFFTGRHGAECLLRGVMSLFENYPRPAFYGGLNLVGSHDRARVLTLLGEGMEGETCSLTRGRVLSQNQRVVAAARLRLLVLLQMTLPGVPCVYYGDEAGLEGGCDPENRKTYPWGRENHEIRRFYETAISLRRAWPVFIQGEFAPFRQGEDVFGYFRRSETDEMAVLVNRCPYHEEKVLLDCEGNGAQDLLTDQKLPAKVGKVSVELSPMGAAVLRLGRDFIRPIHPAKGVGVLCHITSLPSDWGVGQFGRVAEDFIQKLAEAGQRYWQILPLNPTDAYDSPYAGPSAFGGNELLIDPEELIQRNLLGEPEVTAAKEELRGWEGNFIRVASVKRRLLRSAFSRFRPEDDYAAFCRENLYWLEDHCRFLALKEHFEGLAWQEWPEEYRQRGSKVMADPALERAASFFRFCQYLFDNQWKKLKVCANRQGVKIIGDLPFYVSGDSADIWARPEQFRLDERGNPTASAGVPPDYFSDRGQNWNNPLYRWEDMGKEGYRWWVERLRQAIGRYDFVRLDHFRGFERYWAIPEGEEASAGSWKYAPGWELFTRAQKEIHVLPILAEDLGEITIPVRNLLKACGFYGMDVFQFSENQRLTVSGYEAREDAVLYSGTHDNQTLKGWCEARWPDQDSGKMADGVMEKLLASSAPVVILPLQDVLGLGNEARMNTPGKGAGNWHWHLGREEMTSRRWAWLRQWSERSGRFVPSESDLPGERVIRNSS